MLEQTKRISFRISSVFIKVEPEPDLSTGSGSDQKVPAPTVFQYKQVSGLCLLRPNCKLTG